MSNKKRLLTSVVVAAAVAVVSVWFWPANGGEQKSAPRHDEKQGHGGHDEKQGHGGHDEKQGHGDHDEDRLIRLSDKEMAEFALKVETAKAGKLEINIKLPGEVVVNADRIAHIVPRVAGVVSKVRKSLGDKVRVGEVLAVLESRELADAKAAYLAAIEKSSLARTKLAREAKLFKGKISSEQEYLDAKQGAAEARIALRSAGQKLRAFGFGRGYLNTLPKRPNQNLTRYAMKAPFSGSVVQKHVTLGEKVSGSTTAFTIADLRTVWVNLTVYQKHLAAIRKGQPVTIRATQGTESATGTIDYISPFVDESTRTATARVVLANSGGAWRPGIFVTSEIRVRNIGVRVTVPATAIQSIEGKSVIFVKTKEGFEPRPIKEGRSNGDRVEILEGLNPGERFVAKNAFTLKAELGKSELSGGHSH